MSNKVVLLSSASSIHTVQWAKYLAEHNLNIHVITQHPISQDFPKNITVTLLPYNNFLGYFLNFFALKKILKDLKPDLINVHYASGYGTTARLANCHPYILSVWGSDVYEFPYRSIFHKQLLKMNLAAANAIASTSQSMAKQTQIFSPVGTPISITPFGVDLDRFNPKIISRPYNDSVITIGTVKTLKHVYGIDILLNALAILYHKLYKQNSELVKRLNFRIVGGGADLQQLKQLAIELGIANITTFVGAVSHEKVPEELSKLDIYVALSRQESFGVAVVEAQAMGIPVIVSNVGGLPEVVQDGKTGFIVDSENPNQAAEKIEQLIMDYKLRQQMAHQARNFVESNFSWESCANKMIVAYQNTLSIFKGSKK